MKTILRLTLVVLAVPLLIGTMLAVVIKETPKARSSNGDIILTWTTVDETGVQRFDVLRASWGGSGWSDFVVVGTVDQLKGNNSTYEFIDKSVFKTTAGIYGYRIRIINGQTPAPETDIVTVSHTSSAAKRTWGSIKAMFR
jgi:hypothetical protein